MTSWAITRSQHYEDLACVAFRFLALLGQGLIILSFVMYALPESVRFTKLSPDALTILDFAFFLVWISVSWICDTPKSDSLPSEISATVSSGFSKRFLQGFASSFRRAVKGFDFLVSGLPGSSGIFDPTSDWIGWRALRVLVARVLRWANSSNEAIGLTNYRNRIQ